jgi:hypothetical protein
MLEKPTVNRAIAKDRVSGIPPGETSKPSDPLRPAAAVPPRGGESIGFQRDSAIGDVALASDVSIRAGAGAKFRKRLIQLAPHIRRVLYRPAVGSPIVEGTGVPQTNVVELVRLLRQRMAQPEAKGGKLAGRLLMQLTFEQAPGPVTVEGVKVSQLKRLVALLGRIEGEPSSEESEITAKSGM